MSQVATFTSYPAPALIAAAGDRAAYRFLEFFTAQIRNANTRRAYVKAVGGFCDWLDGYGLPSIAAVSSIHIAAYVEALSRHYTAPTVKQRLAAIRMMFNWLATGGVLPFNPAPPCAAPTCSQNRKNPCAGPREGTCAPRKYRHQHTHRLRDRALIALMVYTFARIGAATAMRVEDVFVQNRRLWVRLHEKGGKAVALPCHHNLESYLHAYLDGTGISPDANGPLFRTIGRGTAILTNSPLPSNKAYAMVQRRAEAAGIKTKIGNHTFRATSITAYLRNGGTLERAAAIANHASTRNTQLYDRRTDEVNLDEIGRILI